MKIYLAGRYARRLELLEYAKTLSYLGHQYTSKWLDGDEEGKTQQEVAKMDFEHVREADMVLVFTDPYDSLQKGGGRHTELGIGYALRKHVWIVGEREQVFHHLPGVKKFSSMGEVLTGLDVLKPAEHMIEPTFRGGDLNHRIDGARIFV